MVGQTIIEETILPTVPDQETFSGFWDKVQKAGIMGLGYGVVNMGDHYYVVSPELSSAEEEPGALNTLVQLLNYTIGKSGSGVVPYSYISQTYGGKYLKDQPKGVWEVTLVLHYNPSSPSLYLMARNETIPLGVFGMTGIEVWNQIKHELEFEGRPRQPYFKLNDSRLSEFVDTSVRNIYVLKRVQSHWQAINKRVVREDR